jgi:hypothetical protein
LPYQRYGTAFWAICLIAIYGGVILRIIPN